MIFNETGHCDIWKVSWLGKVQVLATKTIYVATFLLAISTHLHVLSIHWIYQPHGLVVHGEVHQASTNLSVGTPVDKAVEAKELLELCVVFRHLLAFCLIANIACLLPA